jgi:hypothetical protein
MDAVFDLLFILSFLGLLMIATWLKRLLAKVLEDWIRKAE